MNTPPSDRIDAATLAIAASLGDGGSDVLVLVGPDDRIHVVGGSSLLELLGYEELAPEPSAIEPLLHPGDLARAHDAYVVLSEAPGNRVSEHLRVRHRDGQYVPLRVTGVNRRNRSPVAALVIHARAAHSFDGGLDDSIGEESAVRDEAGFVNAVADSVQLKHDKIWSAGRFARSVVKDRRYDYSVLAIELDRFRLLLGTHGQAVAQGLMREITERLRGTLSRADVLGRLRGGEFGLLLRGVGDAAQVNRIADRIQDVCSEPCRVDGHEISTAAVIGICTSERRYGTAQEVLRDAAAALNRARQQHRRRRRAAFDTRIRVEDKQFIDLLRDLHQGLKRQEFYVHYQPIVRLHTGLLSGFEALARWTHPERGTVPSRFHSGG